MELEELRSFVTLGYADEVVEYPEMLSSYCDAFQGIDDATLILYGGGLPAEDLCARVGRVLEATGLDGELDVDIAVLADSGEADVSARVARRVHAVYSRRARAGCLASAPGFAPAELARLRALADEHLGAPDRWLWECDGRPVEVTNRSPLGHFYSPVPNTPELAGEPRRSQIWPARPADPPGIDWREDQQLALCRDVFARQQRLRFAIAPTDDPTEYHTANDQYPALDAWVLEAMLRHLKPRRMIEIGSGWSTLVTARVNRELLSGAMDVTCIEPFPRPFLEAGVPGVSGLRAEQVQDTSLDVFEQLGEGDVLFVDTSHVAKTGSDVNWIYHQILPRLDRGVTVHIHDVLLPRDYPQPWVFEGWGWNEQYLLQSFLAFNSAFEIAFATQWMVLRHRDAVVEAFPGFAEPAHEARSGVSIWLRRNS